MLQPTPLNTLLLRACACDAEALREWEACIDFADHDQDGYLLLPLLKHRADANGWKLDEAARIAGFTRYWWTQNSLRLRALSDLLETLKQAEIPALGIDATALALADYPSPHHRPILTLDLLIPPNKQGLAYNHLRQAGWTAQGYVHTRQLTLYETLGFQRGDIQIKLHWYALPRQTLPGIDDRLWDRAVTVQNETFGFTLNIPCAADRLALRGAVIADHWGVPCPALWRADAMQVVTNTGADLDWERVVETAAYYHRGEALRGLLASLNATLSIPIPSNVLQRKNVSWMEKWEANTIELHPLPKPRAHLIRFAYRVHSRSITEYPSELAHYAKMLVKVRLPTRLKILLRTLRTPRPQRDVKETT